MDPDLKYGVTLGTCEGEVIPNTDTIKQTITMPTNYKNSFHHMHLKFKTHDFDQTQNTLGSTAVALKDAITNVHEHSLCLSPTFSRATFKITSSIKRWRQTETSYTVSKGCYSIIKLTAINSSHST